MFWKKVTLDLMITKKSRKERKKKQGRLWTHNQLHKNLPAR